MSCVSRKPGVLSLLFTKHEYELLSKFVPDDNYFIIQSTRYQDKSTDLTKVKSTN